MSGMSILGSFSGIDQSMIDELMEAERAPLVQLNQKKENATRKQDAWKDVNTRLNSLYDKINALGKASTFQSKVASSTNDGVVSMSVGNSAPEGVYNIKVEQLATNSRVIGGGIKDLPVNEDTDIIDMGQAWGKEGSFTIRNINGEEATIEVKEDHSLRDIVKNINEALIGEDDDLGVKATIVDGRMVLTSEDTGEGNIQLYSGEGNLLSELGLSSSERENQSGQNAKFTINGIDVESDSNQVKNVLEGTTINLHRVHNKNDEGDYDTLTIGIDTEKATEAVEDFVKQYNSTMKFIEEQLDAGDPEESGSKGPLAGDSALMRLHSNLSRMVTDRVKGEDIEDISELGVTTVDRFGELQFDSTKLLNALAENPNKVVDFFSGKEEDGGYSSRLNEEVNYYIAKRSLGEGKKGIIKSTMDSYDNVIKDLNRQIDNFNDRMERKEEYYIRMFTALDIAMMEAESQMAWLQGQVDAMNV